jgi:CHAT domain-containing protein
VPETELQFKDGMRQRLSGQSMGSGFWSRLMVTDADDEEGTTANPHAVAERIKYVYLSERARAEAISQQRQPGLIEALIKEAIKDSRYNSDISRTLFQLMVPLEFKATARQTERLLLVLDGYTANLPWEMLQADEEPLAQKMSMVRQLVSTRFRKNVISSTVKSACVIGNPSTAGFYEHFPNPYANDFNDDQSLASLSGAVEEAQQVSKTLRQTGYEVEQLFPSRASDKPQHTAIDVFNTLFKRPYRILMIAAHGEVNIRGNDGKERTGVVLSDGVMLTAAEGGQMEVVPDLVFLNCCHLAKTDNNPDVGYNRLAYSISRELIEMGVRCVIAAGWAVDDTAACTFSKTFFENFVDSGKPFGDAVLEARRQTYKLHADLNTWGAYQAYGDPTYVLNVENEQDQSSDEWTPVAPQELNQRLTSMLIDVQHKGGNGQRYTHKKLVSRLEKDLSRVPQEWISKPSTQYKLAELYGSILPDGFEKARAACQRSIFEQDKEKTVPIVALEFLGNLEARQAQALSEKAGELRPELNKVRLSDKSDEEKKVLMKPLQEQQKQCFDEATELADSAIKRFRGLLDITHEMHKVLTGGEGDAVCTTNTERFALLGSALKRKAIVMCHMNEKWVDISKVLHKSAEAYKEAEGVSFDYSFDPYASINHMQLSGVLGEPVANAQQLIEKCQESARRNFQKTLDFFPAVMVADAEVAAYLLAPLEASSDEDSPNFVDQVSDLVDYFENSVKDVPRTSRQFHTVIQQLLCLAAFMEKRADPKGGEKNKDLRVKIMERSRVLDAVATELSKL